MCQSFRLDIYHFLWLLLNNFLTELCATFPNQWSDEPGVSHLLQSILAVILLNYLYMTLLTTIASPDYIAHLSLDLNFLSSLIYVRCPPVMPYLMLLSRILSSFSELTSYRLCPFFCFCKKCFCFLSAW